MEEIDLKEICIYLKNKISFIILITCIVLALGCMYSLFIKKPIYTSSSTIVLASSDSNGSSASVQADVTLNQKLVGTYREIVKSRSVLESVIDTLNLPYSYEELSGKVTVTAVANTEILKISVLDRNPKKARDITRSVSNTFSKEISNLYSMKNVNILDEANIPGQASNMSFKKECLIYFAVGIVLSMGILLLMFYFDNTVKSVEQVESKIKLPILGTIPIYSKGGK